jgi:hypothetical protein
MRLPRVPPALTWSVVGVIALALVIVLVAAFFDWDQLRGPVARSVAQRTGRTVRIGELDVDFRGLTPRVTVGDVTLGNPSWTRAWAGPGDVVRVERAVFDVKLLPLLIGRIVIPHLSVQRPVLYLVRNADGRSNWEMQPGKVQPGAAPRLPLVQRFELDDGRVTYIDWKQRMQFNGVVAANETTFSSDPQPFRLVGLGRLNNSPFRFSLKGGPLVNVHRDRPYAFDVELDAGKTHATAHGALTKPFDLGMYGADVSLSGDDMSDLYYLTELAFPNTPPYHLTGHIQRRHTQLTFGGLQGKVGDSDMHGSVEVDLSGERPFARAQLASRALKLSDLGASFGAEPSAVKHRLLPDSRLLVNRVRAMDAVVDYQAQSVNAPKLALKEVNAHATLKDGVLNFAPVSLTTPDGKLSGTMRLDASADVPQTRLDARINGLQLARFRPRGSPEPPLEGSLQGRIQLHGSGDSVAKFASTSAGTMTFVVPHGEVREALVELTGINVARGLGLLMRKDQEKTEVRCGVAEFQVHDGTLEAKNLVFDTDDVLITGKGEVSLDREAFDLTVKGQPKKLRLVRLKSPIAIRGPLLKPDIALQAGNTFTQGSLAAALATLVAPLAAVLAFVDPGLAHDANCSALLAEAHSRGAPLENSDIVHAERR